MTNRAHHRFLIDTNLLIAAVKGGHTKSTDLLIELMEREDIELVASPILISEYERYGERLKAHLLINHLKQMITIVEPKREHVAQCMAYFPENEYGDAVHAATCLVADAVIITNDHHFDRIKEAGVIEVWSISEAIHRLIG